MWTMAWGSAASSSSSRVGQAVAEMQVGVQQAAAAALLHREAQVRRPTAPAAAAGRQAQAEQQVKPAHPQHMEQV